MASCEYYIELLSAGLDGQLTQEQERELADHLVRCPACRELGPQLAAAHAAFAGLEEIPAPEGFARGVMEQIRTQEHKKDKVVPLFRRPQFKAVAGLAACAVLCVGLYRSGLMAPGAGFDAAETSGGAAASAATAGENLPASSAVGQEDMEAYSVEERAAPQTTGGGLEPQAAHPDADTADYGWEEPEHYGFQNEQYIWVCYGQTPEAPSARVLGSEQALTDFLAQFPQDDLSAVAGAYGEDYFQTGRLLAVVVEEGSGSIRHRLDPQGLLRDQVTVVRQVPEVGTFDMASWLILAEVDAMFDGGDVLTVRLETE